MTKINKKTLFQIFFYEWEISMKWKGHVNGKEKEVTGKVEICNLSEEHEDMEDVDLVRMGWPYSNAVFSRHLDPIWSWRL